ncbi:hypothetical protein ACFFSY_15605 [Paenibacillus aurantiacus]|uniref:Uncharacterized protein n=1 Tax=Paenibacillus aurantiacus TaxID=1936118 RepID=A0ABV5KQ41_9BACL
MEQNSSSCAVRRVGIVRTIGPVEAELLVNGKAIRVPTGKLDARAAAGDAVNWDGKYWVPESARRED